MRPKLIWKEKNGCVMIPSFKPLKNKTLPSCCSYPV